MKKVLSLVLALVLALGLTTVAFAADPVPEFDKDLLRLELVTDVKDEVRPGDKVRFDITGGFTNNAVEEIACEITETSHEHGKFSVDGKFICNLDGKKLVTPVADTRSNKTAELPVDPDSISSEEQKLIDAIKNAKVATTAPRVITREDVRKHKLGVQIRVSEGRNVIDKAEIKYEGSGQGARAYVEVTFIDPFVSTKEQDFDVLVYLTHNKSRLSDSEARIAGVFANEVQEVYENDDYVYVYDVPVVKAEDYIRNIKVDLGEGVSINTRMFDGKKYYGNATQDIEAADEAILAAYPDIDTVYKLTTIGLAGTGNIVEFDLDDVLFVYVLNEDGDLVYIGKSNEKLPYHTKYFLAGKELEVSDADLGDEDDIIEPEEETPPITGGDDEGTPPNINDNPATGR